ncbi:MAG: hypothetical protein FWF08_04085 [Oscillospiraceae bacterium]|nr:hypothetical protein [Oscillospiraceae bacterium]
MFAILEILQGEPPAKRPFFKKRQYPYPVGLQREPLDSGSFYYYLRAGTREGHIPWGEIEYAAGRCVKRMLIPDYIEIPRNSRIERYKSEYFPAKIVFNTALKLLENLKFNKKSDILSIIDIKGEAVNEIERFLPFFSRIKIITRNFDKYEHFAERVFDEYGVSLVLSGDIKTADGSFLTVTVPGSGGTEVNNTLNLTLDYTSGPGALSIGKISAPSNIMTPVLDGISKTDFLSAVYELCRVQNQNEVCAKTLFFGGREIKITDAGACLPALLPPR